MSTFVWTGIWSFFLKYDRQHMSWKSPLSRRDHWSPNYTGDLHLQLLMDQIPPQNMGSRTATVQSSCIIEGFQGLMFNLGNVWSNVRLLGKVNMKKNAQTASFIFTPHIIHRLSPDLSDFMA